MAFSCSVVNIQLVVILLRQGERRKSQVCQNSEKENTHEARYRHLRLEQRLEKQRMKWYQHTEQNEKKITYNEARKSL